MRAKPVLEITDFNGNTYRRSLRNANHGVARRKQLSMSALSAVVALVNGGLDDMNPVTRGLLVRDVRVIDMDELRRQAAELVSSSEWKPWRGQLGRVINPKRPPKKTLYVGQRVRIKHGFRTISGDGVHQYAAQALGVIVDLDFCGDLYVYMPLRKCWAPFRRDEIEPDTTGSNDPGRIERFGLLRSPNTRDVAWAV